MITISSPNSDKSEVVAGPYHETFRQLVEASMWYDIIVEKIKKINVKVKEVEIKVNPQNVNNVVGYKKQNIQRLEETYNIKVIVNQDIKIQPEKI